MTYYIIIRGPAGVGKTTISKRLADRLRGESIHIDKLLKKHHLDYFPGEECIPEKNFLKLNEILAPMIIKKLKKGKIVVIDQNFYHKSSIKNLIKKLNYKHFIFTLKASLKECIKRDKTKKGKKCGEDGVRAVYKLASRFDSGIIINTSKKTEKEVVKEILSHLPTPTFK